MDIRKIKKLIELLDESGIAEIEIKEGEESVRISRNGQQNITPMMMPSAMHMPAAAAPAPVAVAAAEAVEAKESVPTGHIVKSPI